VREKFQCSGQDTLALGRLLDPHRKAITVINLERILCIFHILTSQSLFFIVGIMESTVSRDANVVSLCEP
jgi:hypothetical protein